MLEAVARNVTALECASAEVKADRKIVLAAVAQDGEALGFASEALRADPELVAAVGAPWAGQPADIFVKTLEGNTYTFTVLDTDTVASVKGLFEGKEGFPPEQQRLIFAAKQLENGSTLAECGIVPQSTLHVVLRLPPGTEL